MSDYRIYNVKSTNRANFIDSMNKVEFIKIIIEMEGVIILIMNLFYIMKKVIL